MLIAERISSTSRKVGIPDYSLEFPCAPTISRNLGSTVARHAGLDEGKPAAFHFDIVRKLAPLRDEGILIVGSGNLVHNLHAYAWGRHAADPYDWAVRFEDRAKELMLAGDTEPLIDYERLGREALLSIPTPDHYLPLLYVIASRQKGEAVSFPVEGVDGGSISMLSVEVGS